MHVWGSRKGKGIVEACEHWDTQREGRKEASREFTCGWRVNEGLQTCASLWAGAAAAVEGKSSP